MLQQIRDRSSGWLAKVVVVVIAVVFALFGLESIGHFFGASPDQAAKVNGEVINQQTVQRETLRLAMEYPQVSTQEIEKQVLDQLIDSTLYDQFSHKNHMSISDQQLDQLIVSLPDFHDAQNNFSSQIFLSKLAQLGYTPETFKIYLRKQLIQRQLELGFQLGTFATPYEIKQLTDLQNQTRSFRYHVFDAKDLKTAIKISPDQISEYYQQHQQEFIRPEQVQVDYLILDKANLAKEIAPSESQLKTRYLQELAQAPRQVSDIIIKISENQTDEQAQQKIKLIQQQLAKHRSFADLAKQYSEDKFTAAKGGDLGIVSAGIFGQKFDEAVKGLKLNEVSSPIHLGNEIHLIKLTKIDFPSFAKNHDQLMKTLQTEMVEQDYKKVLQQLEDLSFSADNLDSVASALKLTLHHSDWLSKDKIYTFPFNQSNVLDVVFSDQVLKQDYNSDVIDLGNDQHIVLRKTAQRPELQLPLAMVEEKIRQVLITQQTHEALMQTVEKDIDALKTNKVLSLSWEQAQKIDRDNTHLPAALVEGVFRLARPSPEKTIYSAVSLGEDKIALVELLKVENQENTAVEGKIASLIRQQEAVISLMGLLEQLRSEATIIR